MSKLSMLIVVLILAGCGGGGSQSDPEPSVVEADQAAALDAIRAIRQAQSDFMATERRYAQTLGELEDAFLLPTDPDWAGSGYRMRIFPTPAADGYYATLTAPEGDAQLRSFYVDDGGVIRFEVGGAATSESAVLEGEADPERDSDDPE